MKVCIAIVASVFTFLLGFYLGNNLAIENKNHDEAFYDKKENSEQELNCFSSKKMDDAFKEVVRDTIRKELDSFSKELLLAVNLEYDNLSYAVDNASKKNIRKNDSEKEDEHTELQAKKIFEKTKVMVTEAISSGQISLEEGNTLRENMNYLNAEQLDQILSKIHGAYNRGEIDYKSLHSVL